MALYFSFIFVIWIFPLSICFYFYMCTHMCVYLSSSIDDDDDDRHFNHELYLIVIQCDKWTIFFLLIYLLRRNQLNWSHTHIDSFIDILSLPVFFSTMCDFFLSSDFDNVITSIETVWTHLNEETFSIAMVKQLVSFIFLSILSFLR